MARLYVMEKVWQSSRNGFSLQVFLAGSGVFATFAFILMVSRMAEEPPSSQLARPLAIPPVSISMPPPSGASAATASAEVAPPSGSEGGAQASRDEALWTLVDDEDVLAVGQTRFQVFCYACHAGPGTDDPTSSNLFDDQWYHGSAPTDIERGIREGFPAKGMPGWGQIIPEEEVDAIIAYVLSFQAPPGAPAAGGE